MTEPSCTKYVTGWLSKWSNSARKYEKMWFELTGWELDFYVKESAQMCGKISLVGATIDFDETRKFIICHDGEAVHVKADDQRDKQRWVEALNAAIDAASDSISKSREPTDSESAIESEHCTPLSSFLDPDQENTYNDRCVGPTARDAAPEGVRELSELTDSNCETSNENLCSVIQDTPLTIPIKFHLDDHDECEKALTAAIDLVSAEDESFDESNTTLEKKNIFSQQGITLMSIMKQKLKDSHSCNDLINKSHSVLQRSITAVENIQNQENQIFKEASVNGAEYKDNASALTKACTDYIDLAESHCKLYQSELEQRVRLEHIVKSLTQTQSKFRETISEDDESFFDCPETARSSETHIDVALQVYQAVGGQSEHKVRRKRIPDRPNVSDSLWSVLKNCVGSDLTKMPLPVSFSEPLSLLQRLTEDFEYAHVLDTASECPDTATQFAYVAAFISSSYSTTVARSAKPFNPLLGETYECDRQSDLGWRSIAEQVSHHPPAAAIYCEGKSWKFWMDQSMKSKFKGATLTVIPLGECHLNFKNGNRYSWRKPTTSIHNVIVGKLWVEQEGDVDIKCATSDVTCKLTFVSSGWSGDTFTLKGVIKDGKGKAVFDVIGKYSTQIDFRPAGSKDLGTVIWKRTEPPADSAKYYHFTLLACQLNEMEHGIAPTDSRLRPDQRLMEEGKFDDANVMKKKLEEHQRANKKEKWEPSWFKHQADPDTETKIWTYGGEYWPCKAKKDWSRCPSHIFSPP